jgi:hypothetical protein
LPAKAPPPQCIDGLHRSLSGPRDHDLLVHCGKG